MLDELWLNSKCHFGRNIIRHNVTFVKREWKMNRETLLMLINNKIKKVMYVNYWQTYIFNGVSRIDVCHLDVG